MMQKADNSEKTPSNFAVYLGGLFLALLGALMGFCYLASSPLQVFANQADYEASAEFSEVGAALIYSKPGDAHYIEAPLGRSSSWESKRLQLTDRGPQTVRLNGAEINAWMAAKFRKADTSYSADERGILIIPSVPTVGLLKGEGLYLNLPVTLSAYGVKTEYVVSAFGNIEPQGFKIDRLNINCAKVPLPPLIGGMILNALSEAYTATEEYAILSAAFERLDSALVEAENLVLVLR